MSIKATPGTIYTIAVTYTYTECAECEKETP